MVLFEFLFRMLMCIIIGALVFHTKVDLEFILISTGVSLLFMLINPKTRRKMYR